MRSNNTGTRRGPGIDTASAAGLVPAGLVPAGLVPAGLVPAGLVPAGLVSAAGSGVEPVV
ncbi:hypothetical protein [Frankia casuarinae]|uniref:hypothetical protein n=1 Tax=Frankia casuarinae (strain DSM 45818 / CECT 9043 / HFP020203 / CcI3) TaxID=106370 RepID=UPI00031BB987|nr:hypothetical protein [Frankia casuarinae]